MPPLRNNARGNTGIARNIEAVYNPAAAEHYGLENTTDRTEIAIRKKIYCDYNKSYQAQHNGVFPSHRQCVAEIVRQQNHAAIPLNDIQNASLERQKWIHIYDYGRGANLVTAQKVMHDAGIINEYIARTTVKNALTTVLNIVGGWRNMREGYGDPDCDPDVIIRRVAFEAAMVIKITADPTNEEITTRQVDFDAALEKYLAAIDQPYNPRMADNTEDPIMTKINNLKKNGERMIMDVAHRPGRQVRDSPEL